MLELLQKLPPFIEADGRYYFLKLVHGSSSFHLAYESNGTCKHVVHDIDDDVALRVAVEWMLELLNK